jgi:nitrate reductase molybdenum cofactor assembly chaperone
MSSPAIDRRPGASFAEALSSLAPLLEYPRASSIAEALRCRAALSGEHPEAASAVGRLLEWLANEPLETQQEVYTRTFLVMPSCVPYVSVHLFGDESFRRGRLMADLREAYDRAGFDAGTELPDHLAVLLRFAPRLASDELDELVRYCLVSPVTKMAARLERTRNPYLHALDGVRLVLEAVDSEEDPS